MSLTGDLGSGPVIAIHGGAGALSRASMTPERDREYRAALTAIVAAGQAVLAEGGSAVDAVVASVRMLEDSPLFNAGHGAVFTSDGTQELDAAIMDGATLDAGAAAGLHTVRNPITLARSVMESSAHVLFAGEGAERYARDNGIETVDPSYFFTQQRFDELVRARERDGAKAVLDHDGERALAFAGAAASSSAESSSDPIDPERKMGTVGAVARDVHGNLAAATSTGGMTNKQVGRVGDAPLIGSGTYAANATCAVSATGSGEMFIRMVVAHDIAALMEYAGLSLQEAADRVVHEKLPLIDGRGGVIAVDAVGNVAMPFNTEGMYRGIGRVGLPPVVAIHTD